MKRRPVSLWLAVVLIIPTGGWMLFDGLHRVITGDYIRIEGQLGPWAGVVSWIGLDPMSSRMAAIFVVLGAAWITTLVGLFARRAWAWELALVTALLSLFYLPIGTLFSALILLCLFLPSTRRALAAPNETGAAGRQSSVQH